MKLAEYPNLRVAADLTAGGWTSPAVPCLGALLVGFYTKATSATATGTVTFETSMDGGVTWNTAAQSTDFLQMRANIAVLDNTIGRGAVFGARLPSDTGSSSSVIACTHLRLIVAGPGPTGFSVSARVFFAGESVFGSSSYPGLTS